MLAAATVLLLAPAAALAGKVGRPGRPWAENFVPRNADGNIERRYPQENAVSILPVNMTTPITTTSSVSSTRQSSSQTGSTNSASQTTSSDTTTAPTAATSTAPRSSRLSTLVSTIQPSREGEEPVTSTSVLWVSDESTPTEDSSGSSRTNTATDIPEVQPDGMAGSVDAPRGAIVALIGAVAIAASLL